MTSKIYITPWKLIYITIERHAVPLARSKPSTDKTQHHISELYAKAFSPIIVSIGPYHHGTPSLQPMEKKKWNCLHFILNANPEKTLDDYLKALQELYPIAKSCYKEEIKMESNKFVEMLLLDTCFIIVSMCGLDQSSHDPHSRSDETNKHNDLLD